MKKPAALLHVPENWPLMWAGPGNDLIRTACPKCGVFGLVIDRTDPAKPAMACTDCGLSGQRDVQAAFDIVNNRKPEVLPT